LAAGLRPDPVVELKRFPRLPTSYSHSRGPTSNGGRKRKEKEGGEGREEKNRE